MGKWICGYCVNTPTNKYLFASKYNLQRHLQNFHQDPTKYTCPICAKKFRNKYLSTAHFKTAHQGKHNSAVSFSSQRGGIVDERVPASMQRGGRAVELRKESSFDMSGVFESLPPSAACPFCEEVFDSPFLLRDHWRRDHPQETGHQDLRQKDSDEREALVVDNLRNHPQRLILPLLKESSQENTKFKLSQNTFRMAFNEVGIEAVKLGYGSELVAAVFTYVVEEIRKQCKTEQRSYIAFHITADCLDTPLTVPFTQARDFSAEQLLEAIYALGTSDKYIEADDNLSIRMDMLNLEPPNEMTYGAVKPPRGAGLTRLEELARKQSLYGFSNAVQPFDCALVAFVLSQLKRHLGPKYRSHRIFNNAKLVNFEKSTCELRRTKSVRAHGELRDKVSRLITHFAPSFNFIRPQGRDFLLRLQKHMDNCLDVPQQLVVFKDGDWKEPAFSGKELRPLKDRVYFLYLENEHMCFIDKPARFFKGNLHDCCLAVTARKTVGTHRCLGEARFCVKCGGRDCWDSLKAGPDCVCPYCHTFFDRSRCYINHCMGRPNRCETHATCTECLSIRERVSIGSPELKEHGCMQYDCRHCGKTFKASGLEPHLCVYQRPKEDTLGGGDAPFFRVYFDMETCVRGSERRLVPYLTTAIFVCSNCSDDFLRPSEWRPLYRCCGARKRSYWFEDGMRQFLRDTFGGRKDMSRGIAVAYNMRNFDGFFLLSHLLSAGGSPKKVIIAGNRLMSIHFQGVQVKDLNLFLSGSLASLPRSFGIEDLVKKGNFPHRLANTLSFEQMATYESPSHPPLDMYGVETLKSSGAQAELVEWHGSVAEQPFNFKEEAESYCANDTLILALCAEKLDHIIRDLTDGDISLLNGQVITLASLTMTIFRHKYMHVPIGIVPHTGYTPGKHSVMANLYFMYLNQKRRWARRPLIHFALNNCGGEFRIDRRRVDGVCSESGNFYEFQGCYWHACDKCYQNSSSLHPTYKIPFYAARNRDLRRIKQIEKSFDKKVITIRECKVKAALKNQYSLWHRFYHQHRLLLEVEEPATVRGALAGGRTEVFAPYKKLSDDEIRQGFRIAHIDVCSLYPWAQSNNYFPSKPHPDPIDGSVLSNHGFNWGLDDVRQYFGIFSVCLMYLDTPYYPPIPYKARGKGIYGCCRLVCHHAMPTVSKDKREFQCMESNCQLRCRHNKEQQRAFKAVLTSVDLELALENGAVLLKVYSILDYGKLNITKDMYRNMMMPLVRGKLLAKGKAGRSRAQLEEMAKAWDTIGISLHPDEFTEFKPVLYLVYKLLMNSLWGKQAQINRSSSKEIVSSAGKAAAIIWDPMRRLMNATSIGAGQSLFVETQMLRTEQAEEHSAHNPLVAAFVTAYGRRALHRGLVQCGKRALYCDTDSIIYISDPRQRHKEPYIDPHGLLGSWVNELKDGHFIRAFVASAPKCYYYVVVKERDPFGTPVDAKYRMKGIGLNAGITSALSLESLHMMAVRQVEELREHYEDVLDRLASGTSEDHVAAARAKTRSTGHLHLPQTNLHKIASQLKILDKSSVSSKMIRFNFDKRVLQKEYCCLDFIPSLPFGTRPDDYDN